MIVGIGTDLIEIKRVLKACEKDSFVNKIYTEEEIKLGKLDKRKFADNFAVKESISKMIGTGFREVIPKEIEVLRDPLGKPYVNLYGKCLEIAKNLEIDRILVSISNTKEYSIAFAVGEKE